MPEKRRSKRLEQKRTDLGRGMLPSLKRLRHDGDELDPPIPKRQCANPRYKDEPNDLPLPKHLWDESHGTSNQARKGLHLFSPPRQEGVSRPGVNESSAQGGPAQMPEKRRSKRLEQKRADLGRGVLPSLKRFRHDGDELDPPLPKRQCANSR
jgi:hypothetical protein